MKRIVTGDGVDGLSKVVSSGEPRRSWRYGSSTQHAPHDNPRGLTSEPFGEPGELGAWVAELWTTREVGPDVVGEDPGAYTDDPGAHSLEVPAGVARFSVVRFGPGYHSKMHSTDSIDLDICLSGELDLVLESEVVRLLPGDVAVVPGSRHVWRTETGASFAFVMLSPHASGNGGHQ